RKYYVHSNEQLLRQKLYQMIADDTADDAADQLTNDSVFKEIIGTDALASQPSLSRFLNRFDEASVEQLYQDNQELLDKVHAHRGAESLILDLDSTHADTYGDQEETAFNAHYETVGFHPLVAFDGVTGDFLKPSFALATSTLQIVWYRLFNLPSSTIMRSPRKRRHSYVATAALRCQRYTNSVK